MFYCQFYHLWIDHTDNPNATTKEIRNSFDVAPLIYYYRR